MEIISDTEKEGVLIKPDCSSDHRGSFIKTYRQSWFQDKNLCIDYTEEFYTISEKNVLRGLHFQIPPHSLEKLVYVVYGEIFDVIVDLRKKSGKYGKFETYILSETNKNMLYIPKGFAHGFFVTSEKAIVMYKTSCEYNPQCDCVIRWNSVGIEWPSSEPILSKRDSSGIHFKDFISPF